MYSLRGDFLRGADCRSIAGLAPRVSPDIIGESFDWRVIFERREHRLDEGFDGIHDQEVGDLLPDLDREVNEIESFTGKISRSIRVHGVSSRER